MPKYSKESGTLYRVVVYSVWNNQPPSKWCYGPYNTIGAAKAMKTRQETELKYPWSASKNIDSREIYIEQCVPDWQKI